MIELIAIKKNNKYYVRHDKNNYYSFSAFLFDKEELPSFSENWKVFSELPSKMRRIHSASTKTIGYKLKDGFVASEKTPLELPEDAFKYLGDDKYKNADIQGLYDTVSGDIAEWYEDIEFNITVIDEDCEPLLNPKYPYVTDFPYFIENDEAVRHKYPCHIEAETLFKIIVNFCKDNLPAHCQITSDYSFSFVVENKVTLVHEETHRVDTSRGNSRKPRIEIKPLRSIPFKVINISPPGQKYGLTINSLTGKDYYELESKIDLLLNEYKDKMNQKLIVCPYCKGYGYTQTP